jgi:hypothetical protein
MHLWHGQKDQSASGGAIMTERRPNFGTTESRKAYQYLLNHFEKLTRFLSAPGVPIDNNAAERVLKRFVLFRKNSLFYKTEHGAAVGGILMSLIESCRLNCANPWEYLLTPMRNKKAARRNPAAFLPWNYSREEEEEEALARAA